MPNERLHDLRPYRQLLALGAEFPGVWQRAESLILRKPHPDGRQLPTWPGWCLLPVAGWEAVLPRPVGNMQSMLAHAEAIGRMAAIGTWRYCQGYYAFDCDVYTALTATPISGDIPCSALYRLPEWCVYIETPGLTFDGMPIHGVYAHLESDAGDHRPELRLLLDGESMPMPVYLHLGDWSVAEGIRRMYSEADRMKQYHEVAIAEPPGMRGKLAVETERVIGLVLPLILYLCSDEPEVADGREPGVFPHRNRPHRTKQGKRIFVPTRPRVWDVGKPTGECLRRAVAEHVARRGVQPHIRRAHWHGFWSGPMDGERKFAYKWLPPIVVGGDD